ncbi:hypothetical protein WH52_14630, partial [Tenacibaculum holothuriorum]
LPTEPALTSAVAYNCDGTGNITITAAPVGSYTYTLGGSSNSTGVFNNQAVGNHTITVDYGSGCTKDITVNVADDQEFMASVIRQSDVTCFGGTDGSITIEASQAPFDYNYNGTWLTSTTTEFTITGLDNITYSIQVRPNATSPAACTLSLPNVTLSEPAEVVANAAITKQVTCNPATGATIQPSAVGGTGTYTFELRDGATVLQTAVPFTNVPAGSYTIVAIDGNTCRSQPYPITIVSQSSVAFTATTANCFNGEINVNITGGNDNYRVILNGGAPVILAAGVTTYTFTGLAAATYTVDVIDGFGCTTTQQSVTIHPELTASATIDDPTCNDGEIDLNVLGGTGAGTYVYSAVTTGSGVPADATFNTTLPILRGPGTYDIYIRDNSGNTGYCQIMLTETVGPVKPNPTITSLTSNSPRCFGELGTVDVVITNGEAPYSLTLTDGGSVTRTITANSTTASFVDIPVGNYTVTVTDVNGCSPGANSNISVTSLPELNATLEGILPATCVDFTVDNSGYGFRYLVPASAVPSAPYTLQLRRLDGTWVTYDSSDITTYEFTGINPGTVVNGALRILDASNNVVCINYLDRFETPFVVNGLIVNPISNPSDCSTGFSVTVEAINGTGPFQFAIDDPNGTWFTADGIWTPDNPTGTGVPGADPTRTLTFTGLTPGLSYTFYVRDTNNTPGDTSDDCIEQNNEDINGLTPTVTVTGVATNNSCAGATDTGVITFSINNPTPATGLSDPFDYTLYLRDPITNVGSPVAGYTAITQNGFADIVVGTTPNPPLAEGDYYIEVTGTSTSGFCTWGSEDVTITKGEPITGNVVKVNDITCSTDGVVNIENVVGGFGPYTYTISVSGGATYTLSGTTITVPYLAALAGGTVNVGVTVTDSNGCSEVLTPISLDVSNNPTIAPVTTNSCGTNTITVDVTSGVAPYQYSIDNGANYTTASTTDPYTFTNVAEGVHNVIVRDATGCTSAVQAVTINPEVEFSLSMAQNLTCAADAEIRIDITSGTNLGATGNFSYTITGPSPVAPTTRTITGAATNTTHAVTTAGTYQVVVTDVTSGCVASAKQIDVVAATLPNFSAIASVDNICFGSSDGVIEVTATDNGILPLEYRLSSNGGTTYGAYQTSTTFSGLTAGTTYVVEARSTTNNCTRTQNVTITENADIDISGALTTTQFGCNANTNVTNNAVVSITTGSITPAGTYNRFVFVYDNNTPGDTTDDVTQDGSSTSFEVNNVAGGSVSVTAYNAQGCSDTVAATINPFNGLSNAAVALTKALDCRTPLTVG